MSTFQHVVVATDLSAASTRAVNLAADIAGGGGTLTLLHVVDIPAWSYLAYPTDCADMLAPLERLARRDLAEELARVQERIPAATSILRRGIPADLIVDTARDAGGDLLIVGTHGRTGLDHLFLGSVAEKVVRTSSMPVLTVRSDAGG